MKVTALSPINHDGKQINVGDTFEIEGAQMTQLLDAGAIEAASVTSAKAKQAAAASQAAEDADAQARTAATQASGNAG
jgi:hypothetical protein